MDGYYNYLCIVYNIISMKPNDINVIGYYKAQKS